MNSAQWTHKWKYSIKINFDITFEMGKNHQATHYSHLKSVIQFMAFIFIFILFPFVQLLSFA